MRVGRVHAARHASLQYGGSSPSPERGRLHSQRRAWSAVRLLQQGRRQWWSPAVVLRQTVRMVQRRGAAHIILELRLQLGLQGSRKGG